MRLHENKELFQDAVLATSQIKGISEIYIEKDYKNNNEWLKTHPAEAAIFSQPEITWENIKSPYKTTFSELVIGDLPKEKELIETLKLVYYRLRKVTWEVQFP